MTDTYTIAGHKFETADAFSFGDYGGAGSVGLANIRVATEGDTNVFTCGYQDIERAAERCQYRSDTADELLKLCEAGNPPDVIHCSGGYSSETVYIRSEWEAGAEMLASVADYAALDDEAVSQVEMEWEDEAWESWLQSDLERAAWPHFSEPEDDNEAKAYGALSDDDKRGAYQHAMEVCNEYPTPEYNGVHVDVDRIAPTYRATVERLMKGDTLDAIRAEWIASLKAPAC